MGMDSDTELRSTDKEKTCEFLGLVRRIPSCEGCALCFFLKNTEECVSASHTDPC